MEASARGASEAGGLVVGILPGDTTDGRRTRTSTSPSRPAWATRATPSTCSRATSSSRCPAVRAPSPKSRSRSRRAATSSCSASRSACRSRPTTSAASSSTPRPPSEADRPSSQPSVAEKERAVSLARQGRRRHRLDPRHRPRDRRGVRARAARPSWSRRAPPRRSSAPSPSCARPAPTASGFAANVAPLRGARGPARPRACASTAASTCGSATPASATATATSTTSLRPRSTTSSPSTSSASSTARRRLLPYFREHGGYLMNMCGRGWKGDATPVHHRLWREQGRHRLAHALPRRREPRLRERLDQRLRARHGRHRLLPRRHAGAAHASRRHARQRPPRARGLRHAAARRRRRAAPPSSPSNPAARPAASTRCSRLPQLDHAEARRWRGGA